MTFQVSHDLYKSRLLEHQGCLTYFFIFLNVCLCTVYHFSEQFHTPLLRCDGNFYNDLWVHTIK